MPNFASHLAQACERREIELAERAVGGEERGFLDVQLGGDELRDRARGTCDSRSAALPSGSVSVTP